jgi:hypothetical protein
MAFTAMVLAHRARVSCKRSQADTASQCYTFLLRVRVHVLKRERCSGAALILPGAGTVAATPLVHGGNKHGDCTFLGKVVWWTHPRWR